MVNGLSFDVEDWFQVENLRDAITRGDWPQMPLRVEHSTHGILEQLADADTRATFFFLGWIGQRCPQLVRAVVDAGHEVASHGYGHELVYHQTPESFRADVLRSKQLLEDLSGQPVRGYRAPSFSITKDSLWAIDVLRETGFEYDSSVFPISFHDRYGLQNFGVQPYRWPNGLLEIPLAVCQFKQLAMPVAGGGYFRLLPYWYFRTLLARVNREGRAFAFYLHPWEFDPQQPRVRVKWSYRFRHYVNLNKTAKRMARLLRDFRFDTMSRVFVPASLSTVPA
jgi:polysaccharide deacetylase family protein (PEP-CTERM system associated)